MMELVRVMKREGVENQLPIIDAGDDADYNKTKSFTYKNWQKIKKYKKSDVIVFYKKFINNYLYLNKKYLFNKELSKKYISDQIRNIKKKKIII